MEITPKKSLGQHFLNNARIPEKMVAAAHITPGETVVEVGPGTGVLTAALLQSGANVLAIETDGRAIEFLAERFYREISAEKLVILNADMRSLRLRSLNLAPHSYKVVANIPYYLSGRLFRLFLASDYQPATLVFLVQKEVAERIARSAKESLFSLSVKAFSDPQYIETVKRGNFTPSPKVDSAIIAVYNISRERLGDISDKHFFALIHAGFGSRRKQLFGNLQRADIADPATLTTAFAAASIPLTARGEDVPFPSWLILCRHLFSR